MRLGFLAFVLIFLPAFAFADNVPAGFAPGSLWVSTTQATAGDTLTIYTVVYDSSMNSIQGDVSFTVDGASIAGQHFTLAAGASQILSVKWTATAGSHTFAATIANVSGIASAAITTETNTASITVAPAQPSAISQLTGTASTIIASSSPTVQNIAQTVIGTTEDLRKKGADWLSNALYDDQSIASSSRAAVSSTVPAGQVLGISTYRAPTVSWLATAKHWILTVLLAVFQTMWLFYVMLLVVIYILYKVIQGFFRYRE